MRKLVIFITAVCLLGAALGYGLLHRAPPAPVVKSEPVFQPWTAVVDTFFAGKWGEDAEAIPSTVIDTGVLKNVPYCSWRAGDFELNIYGDTAAPACMECGVYGAAAHDPAAQAKVREFMAAAVTHVGARELVSKLKAEGETGVAGGFTIETTPPEAADAYGGWWVSVYSETALAAARATDNEMKELTMTIDPAAETGGNASAETPASGVLAENVPAANPASATNPPTTPAMASGVMPVRPAGSTPNPTYQAPTPPVRVSGSSYPMNGTPQTVVVVPTVVPAYRSVSLLDSGWTASQFSKARPSTTVVVVNSSPSSPMAPSAYPSSASPAPAIRSSATPPPIPASPAPAIRTSSTPPPIPSSAPPVPAIRTSATPPPIPSSATPAPGIHISSTPANHTVDSSTPLHVTTPSVHSTPPAAVHSGPSISIDSSHSSSLTVHSGSSSSTFSSSKTVYVQSYTKSSGTYKASPTKSSSKK